MKCSGIQNCPVRGCLIPNKLGKARAGPKAHPDPLAVQERRGYPRLRDSQQNCCCPQFYPPPFGGTRQHPQQPSVRRGARSGNHDPQFSAYSVYSIAKHEEALQVTGGECHTREKRQSTRHPGAAQQQRNRSRIRVRVEYVFGYMPNITGWQPGAHQWPGSKSRSIYVAPPATCSASCRCSWSPYARYRVAEIGNVRKEMHAKLHPRNDRHEDCSILVVIGRLLEVPTLDGCWNRALFNVPSSSVLRGMCIAFA